MPFEKRTIVFSMVTTPSGTPSQARAGGWTESVYTDSPPTSQQIGTWLELLAARAALLPVSASITGWRRQQVDPVGSSSSFSVHYPGSSGLQNGLPQKCIFFRIPAAGAANNRPTYIRCVPDAILTGGEYQPTPAFKNNLDNFVAKLSYYRMKGRNLAATQYPLVEIVTVSGATTARTEEAHTLIQGNMVRIMRALDADQQFQGGRFQVVNPVTAFEFNLVNWNRPDTEGGRVRLDEYVYPMIQNIATTDFLPVAVTKKVGAPSLRFRGRVSKRR